MPRTNEGFPTSRRTRTTVLQTLADIPNTQARRDELQYRLDNLDQADRLQLLCLTLDDPYPPIRHDVAEAMRIELGGPRKHRKVPGPVEALTLFLEATVSGHSPSHEVTEKLRVPRELLVHDSLRARIAACVALEASPTPRRTAEVLKPLLRADDDDLRYHTLIATHHLLGDSPLLRDIVIQALDDRDAEIVVVATQIAVKYGWKEMMPHFLHARSRLLGEDRTQITFSMGALIDNSELDPSDLPPEARQDMIVECVDALSHEPHTAAAIKTLGHLRAQEAAEEINGVMKAWLTHPILKVEAAAALVDLGDRRGQKYLGQTLNSRRKDARGYALRIVGERRLEQFFSELVDVARSNDYHADTAVLALADYGGADATDVLQAVSQNHPDQEVRRLATRCLERGLAVDPASFDASLETSPFKDRD